jgi:hypothetical protein
MEAVSDVLNLVVVKVPEMEPINVRLTEVVSDALNLIVVKAPEVEPINV